jgi:pilus assembly protein CpaF
MQSLMDDTVTINVRLGAEMIGEQSFPLETEISVGRSSDSSIVLDSRGVSRKHAIMVASKSGVSVRNLSPNGILLGAKPSGNHFEAPFGAEIGITPFTLVPRRADTDGPNQDRPALRRRVLRDLIEHIDLGSVDAKGEGLRPRVEAALERLLHRKGIPAGDERTSLVTDLANEALGLGPIEELLTDDSISEIMVIDHENVYVERNGRLEKTHTCFTSQDSVRTIIERIVTPLGRRIDEASPMVDARLPDGSRVNAIIPPLAIRGPTITIRKFASTPLSIEDLIRFKTLDRSVADFLFRAVTARHNIVISGGTGSGKTTLLNVIASAIPFEERIVTIEDAAELRLPQPHVVTLETRPPNAEGKGQVTIRDLVRNALRMRPDRIVVGECRSGEALDMLQAMNTGHDGSLTTTHANSPTEALSRLETLSLMAGLDLPSRAIREQIAAAVDLVVQQARMPDGSRRITSIAEVVGMGEDGGIATSEIFRLVAGGPGQEGESFLCATGWLPSFTRAES